MGLLVLRHRSIKKALRHTAEEEERAHPHLTTSLTRLPEMFTKSMPNRRDVIKRLALPPIGRERNQRVRVPPLFYSIIKMFSSSCLIFRIPAWDSLTRYMDYFKCYILLRSCFPEGGEGKLYFSTVKLQEKSLLGLCITRPSKRRT